MIVLVRVALLQKVSQRVCEGHVSVGECGPDFAMILPEHHARLAVRMIPRAALLADTVAAIPAVVRRSVELGVGRVLFEFCFDVRQPVLPHRGIGLTQLRVTRVRECASRSVRLQGEKFRIRLKVAFVPVAESMAAIDSK